MIEFAPSLIDLLNALGARQSNPVLEVIAGDASVELEKKYPARKGYLGNGTWRAFYHCHDSQSKLENEHGHFHLFINAENDSDSSHWPHLASLSMDYMGQPIQWFTVNQWVTGGNWLYSDQLIEGISNCRIDEDMSLVEKWLMSMMNVYHAEISQLLTDRDICLNKIGLQTDRLNILKDRDIYTLSAQAINLHSKLETTFSEQVRQDIG